MRRGSLLQLRAFRRRSPTTRGGLVGGGLLYQLGLAGKHCELNPASLPRSYVTMDPFQRGPTDRNGRTQRGQRSTALPDMPLGWIQQRGASADEWRDAGRFQQLRDCSFDLCCLA